MLKGNSDKTVGYRGHIGDFGIKYLDELEVICETALARELGP
jgi:hypothetical protein